MNILIFFISIIIGFVIGYLIGALKHSQIQKSKGGSVQIQIKGSDKE